MERGVPVPSSVYGCSWVEYGAVSRVQCTHTCSRRIDVRFMCYTSAMYVYIYIYMYMCTCMHAEKEGQTTDGRQAARSALVVQYSPCLGRRGVVHAV